MNVDPRVRMIAVLWVGVGSILFDSWQPLLLLLCICSLPTLLHPKVKERISIVFTSMFIVIWGTSISQGLFYAQMPREILISVGGVDLYREGIVHGLIQSLRFLSVILAGVSFSIYTSPNQIFRGMIALQIPYSLALMAMTALRSITVVTSEVQHIRKARDFRGRALWKRNPIKWTEQELMMFKPIVIRAYQRSLHISEALILRGFTPNATRTQYRSLSMRASDLSLLCVMIVSLIGLVFARTMLWLYQTDLYYHSNLRGVYEWTKNWM